MINLSFKQDVVKLQNISFDIITDNSLINKLKEYYDSNIERLGKENIQLLILDAFFSTSFKLKTKFDLNLLLPYFEAPIINWNYLLEYYNFCLNFTSGNEEVEQKYLEIIEKIVLDHENNSAAINYLFSEKYIEFLFYKDLAFNVNYIDKYILARKLDAQEVLRFWKLILLFINKERLIIDEKQNN